MSLPELLRHTRKSRGLSQLDLALELGVSQRHVSYLECGKAQPSRDLLLAWMSTVKASLSLCNAALWRLGYSRTGPLNDNGDYTSRTVSSSRELMAAHDPFPAILFNADWIALELNRGSQWLSSVLLPEFVASHCEHGGSLDMIAALIHPDGLLSRMKRPELAAYSLLRQLQAEQWVRPTLQPRVNALAESLASRFGPPPLSNLEDRIEPHLRFEFETHLGSLTFLTSQSVHSLPQDVTVASLRTEIWVPTDQFTRDVMTCNAARIPAVSN